MKCSSCGSDNCKLQVKYSKLLVGNRLLLCDDCTGMEPRYLVVLYGRQHGLSAISALIRRKRYRGDEIKASELV